MGSRHQDDDAAEARSIIHALRTLQENPKLLDEPRSDLPAALDQMGLSGIARHAIAVTLALSVSGVLAVPGTPVFWSTP